MQKKSKKKSEKKISFLKKHIFDILLFLVIFCGISYLTWGRALMENIQFHFFEKEVKKEVSESEIKSIGELSTLKAYYHNVAEYNQDSAGVFKYVLHYGYKKCWIEYDGIVQMGVDANQIQVQQPDENNVVQIYMPEAQVLSVDADASSISDPIMDTGAFTKISVEEKNQAYIDAQTNMEEDARLDTALLNKAQKNAKEIIEKYVKSINEDYKVEWVTNKTE